MTCRTALLLATLLLSSCSTPPTVSSYAEYEQRYPKSEDFDRVIFNFNEACNDKGQCIVSAEIIDSAARVMTKLNDTIDSLVLEINKKTDSLIECKMANDDYRIALFYKDQIAERERWVNGGKSIASFLGLVACFAR